MEGRNVGTVMGKSPKQGLTSTMDLTTVRLERSDNNNFPIKCIYNLNF